LQGILPLLSNLILGLLQDPDKGPDVQCLQSIHTCTGLLHVSARPVSPQIAESVTNTLSAFLNCDEV
jgi:hypothetical protein